MLTSGIDDAVCLEAREVATGWKVPSAEGAFSHGGRRSGQ